MNKLSILTNGFNLISLLFVQFFRKFFHGISTQDACELNSPDLFISRKSFGQNITLMRTNACKDTRINLSLMLNCFQRDLCTRVANIKFKFKSNPGIYLPNFRNSVNLIFENLIGLFLDEAESGENILSIDCKAEKNGLFATFELCWISYNHSDFVSPALFEAVRNSGGCLFINSDLSGKSTLKCCLPAVTEMKNNSEFTLMNISSLKDLEFLEDLNYALNHSLNNNQFSVDWLTRELGVSRMQLHRKVKQFLGMSPGNLFQFIRMMKARELLQSGDMKIGEIAYSLGYCDQSHFSKAFKAWHGHPPVEFNRGKAA